MAIIVTRQTGATAKGSPLTNTELDNNFINLNDAINNAESSVVLNDISSQFDGLKGAFSLRLEQSTITSVTDSKNLEVLVNGKKLYPYVTTLPYPWLTPFDTITGYRVRSSTLIIYSPPSVGDTALLTYKTPGISGTQIKRYPFSATVVAFGE